MRGLIFNSLSVMEKTQRFETENIVFSIFLNGFLIHIPFSFCLYSFKIYIIY